MTTTLATDAAYAARARAPADMPAAMPAHDPFDAEFAAAMHRDVLGPIGRHWFRTALFGAHRIPARGPVIIAANHSGNAFPYDAVAVDAALWRHDGYAPAAKARPMFEPGLTLRWWMRPFGLDDLWRRGGGVDMTFDNLDRLLDRGDRVLYFPEGVPGIGKGFHKRYQLQRFSTSFVLLGARRGAPVVPLYVINGEWINPFGYPLRALDRVFQRVFGVPFFPLPIGVLGIVFPFVWFFAFPANLVVVAGEPIDVARMAADAGVDLDRPQKERLNDVAARVRHRMQVELDALVALHGEKPYRWRTLLDSLRGAGRSLWRSLPTGWPIAFLRAERDRRRGPARGRLHALLRDWDVLLFYVPFGWPLLTLARRLRKPPDGYRGMSREERRRRCGELPWHLKERPLPPRDRGAGGA